MENKVHDAAPPRPSLTIHERILLHLRERRVDRDAYSVPRELTQAGISAAVGIRVAHASRELGKLLDGGLVEERDGPVQGSKRRLKAYLLTREGTVVAERLSAEVGELPGAAPAAPHAAGPATVSRELPENRYFFGREDELRLGRRLIEERGVLAVLGIAGIGKSTLGARLFSEVRATRATVWVTLHDYDSPLSVLCPVARLLAMTGRPRLEILTRRESDVDFSRAKELLLEDAPACAAAVFFDDVQSASPETLQALRMLREAASAHPTDFKLVLLSRSRPPIYDERDLSLRKTVGEIELHGLGPVDAAQLLGVADKRLDAEAVYAVTGGHPLFIELLRDAKGTDLRGGFDRRPLDRFVVEQIFSHLSPPERDALRRIVFFRRPIDPRAFLKPPASLDSLLTLEGRSLVRRDARGRVICHEAIRDFIRRTLTETEEDACARDAFAALFDAAEEAETRYDPADSIAYLEDALALAPDDRSTVDVLAELAASYLALAQYSQAASKLEQALSIMARDPADPRHPSLLYLVAATHSEAGLAQSARNYLDRAAAAAAGAGAGPAEARLALEYAKWELRYGTSSKAAEWIRKARASKDDHDRDFIEAEALILMSHVVPIADSNRQLDLCIDLALRRGFLPTLSRAHMTYAWHLVDAYGDTNAALAHAREALKVAESLGNPSLISGARAAIAKAHWRAGDLVAALENAKAGVVTGGKNFAERIVPVALLATLTTESGDAKGGEAMARALLDAAERHGTPFEILMAKRALMRSLVAQRRNDEAAVLLESCHEVYARASIACDLPVHIGTLTRLLRIEVARGNRERARHWFDEAEARIPLLPTSIGEVFRHLNQGHFLDRDDPGRAVLCYWLAAEALAAVGWHPMQVRILHAAWDCRKRAQAAATSIPAEAPTLEVIQRRIDSISGRLNIPGRDALWTGTVM